MAQDNLATGVGASAGNETQVLAKKRTRHTAQTSGSHKRLRGRRGALTGLMNMPVEIFAEIAYLLTPSDLVALLWSSKFFRGILLQRSAINMWREATNNIPGLPPCPPGMSEPQYAVLMFAKYCTLCGTSTSTKPDPDLYARLCTECRKNGLLEIKEDTTPFREFFDYSERTNSSRSSRVPKSIFVLSVTIDTVVEKHDELEATGDLDELTEWKTDRRQMMVRRREHTVLIRNYLQSVDKSRGEQLRDFRRQREQGAVERLVGLGWIERDVTFSFAGQKLWDAFISVPKPLTERVWANMLPKLNPILQVNRPRRIAFDKRSQRCERRRRIDMLLDTMKCGNLIHPAQLIVDAIQPQSPWFGIPCFKHVFPNTSYVLTWDSLADLSEREITADEVEAEFLLRQNKIERQILEWRDGIKRQLAAEFIGEANQDASDGGITILGGVASSVVLSRNQRLLLRADTVFKDTCARSYRPDRHLYYPSVVTDHRLSFYEYASAHRVEDSPNDAPDIDMSRYKRNIEAERVIKRLLEDLGTPDATHIELQYFSSRYVCEKCEEKTSETWDGIVYHLISAKSSQDLWRLRCCPIKTPIIYRNMHDLVLAARDKPLIRKHCASPTIQAGNRAPAKYYCYLCIALGGQAHRFELDHVMTHTQEAHEITKIKAGIHFGEDVRFPSGQQWADSWNKLNAAKKP